MNFRTHIKKLTSQAKKETNQINNSTNNIQTFDIEDNLSSNFEISKSHEAQMLTDVIDINELDDQQNCTKSSKEDKKDVALNVCNGVKISKNINEDGAVKKSNGTTEKNDINTNNQSTNNKVTYE